METTTTREIKERTEEFSLRGNTYPQRNYLKAHGWRWSPEGQEWYKRIAFSDGDLVRGDGSDKDPRYLLAVRANANRPGCALYLGMHNPIWASKTHSARAQYMGDAAAIARAKQETHDL